MVHNWIVTMEKKEIVWTSPQLRKNLREEPTSNILAERTLFMMMIVFDEIVSTLLCWLIRKTQICLVSLISLIHLYFFLSVRNEAQSINMIDSFVFSSVTHAFISERGYRNFSLFCVLSSYYWYFILHFDHEA